jgi:hypothetical protein
MIEIGDIVWAFDREVIGIVFCVFTTKEDGWSVEHYGVYGFDGFWEEGSWSNYTLPSPVLEEIC